MHFRVLVVDDEPAICRLIAVYLRDLRLAGEFAGDGESALSIFERDAQAFDALLLDLNLPDISGMFVLEAVRRIRNPGCGDVWYRRRGSRRPSADTAILFPSKPFAAASLLNAITFASLLSEVGAGEAAGRAKVESREQPRF